MYNLCCVTNDTRWILLKRILHLDWLLSSHCLLRWPWGLVWVTWERRWEAKPPSLVIIKAHHKPLFHHHHYHLHNNNVEDSCPSSTGDLITGSLTDSPTMLNTQHHIQYDQFITCLIIFLWWTMLSNWQCWRLQRFFLVAMKEIMLGSLNHNQPYMEITNSIFALKNDF